MEFNLGRSIEILVRTPVVLTEMLSGLDDKWTLSNEGDDTWSPYDVMGHLINGEKTDWIPRMQIILYGTGEKRFPQFDRFAQFEASKGKTLEQLLDEFKQLRGESIKTLRAANLSDAQFKLQGIHPAFGPVTLSQLLATWTVHDMTHISQIVRIMAVQYKEAVGPWVEYLGVLKR